MNDNEFVKIENKVMPVDDFKYNDFDSDMETNSQSGFTNLVFLAGLIVTGFMWGILIFLGR